MAKRKKMLYDTQEKKAKFVRKRGNIITFKQPFNWMGESYTQIMVSYLEKSRGHVKINGFGKDSPWYDSIDKLIDAVNWEQMERWHTGDDLRD